MQFFFGSVTPPTISLVEDSKPKPTNDRVLIVPQPRPTSRSHACGAPTFTRFGETSSAPSMITSVFRALVLRARVLDRVGSSLAMVVEGGRAAAAAA